MTQIQQRDSAVDVFILSLPRCLVFAILEETKMVKS